MRWPRGYVAVAEALGVLEAKSRLRPRFERVCSRTAFARVLAEDVVARKDVPACDTSLMDGYAVRAADLALAKRGRPVWLNVRGEMRRGETKNARLQRGEAFAVSTGSRLPAGADSVLKTEDARRRGGRVGTTNAPEPWQYVYRAGADLKIGELVLSRGRVMKAQDVGTLIQLGVMSVRVHRKPRVGLIATGSELTDSLKPAPGKVAETHGPVFSHILRELGCVPVYIGIVPDDVEKLSEALRTALRKSDIVLMMGGTSRGTHDLGELALRKLRPEAAFHGLRLDRGRVTGGAVVGGKPVLMAPGPIQAATNCLLVLALPLIRRLLGGAELVTKVPVRMSGNWKGREGYKDFTKVVYLRVWKQGSFLSAQPVVAETESMFLLTASNAFAVVPQEVAELRKGQLVEAVLLPGFSSA
jgi:molybdenum cofactor synthesis domain-containing protein